jgi:2-amino-4-hydroxy-6-hydroxymethyldihydropteridine diphosphokinase
MPDDRRCDSPTGASLNVYLGLGTNVGDLAANLDFACRELEAGDVRVLRKSSSERTDPVGGVEQPRFLNQVVEGETELEPQQLLMLCKLIERRAGRDPTGRRWGPRILDIDILLYGDQVIDSQDLVVPHPEMAKRAFVLRELLEIQPELIDPRSGRPLQEIAASL